MVINTSRKIEKEALDKLFVYLLSELCGYIMFDDDLQCNKKKEMFTNIKKLLLECNIYKSKKYIAIINSYMNRIKYFTR